MTDDYLAVLVSLMRTGECRACFGENEMGHPVGPCPWLKAKKKAERVLLANGWSLGKNGWEKEGD